jgi:FkbM family methyltransferase
MNIYETKLAFSEQKLSKPIFIDRMHDFHRVLFYYAENLKSTQIEKIEIIDGNVLFVTRETKYQPGGCKFYVDIIDKRVTPIETFNFDMYEKEDSEMLFRLVKNGDTIFDIGANIGWYTNHLSKKLPKSQIYSFEPIPETFSQLKNNTIINDSKNVILNNIALSAKIETLSFYYSPTVTGASSTRNITDNLNMFRLECNANTIDNYMSQNNIEKLDFVKCDVEGAEYFVFQGGKDTFKNHLPIVFTEMLRKWAKKFDYHPNDIINYLSQFGYQCFICSKGKLKSIECIYDSTLETNFFFLHPTKHINILNSII